VPGWCHHRGPFIHPASHSYQRAEPCAQSPEHRAKGQAGEALIAAVAAEAGGKSEHGAKDEAAPGAPPGAAVLFQADLELSQLINRNEDEIIGVVELELKRVG
jgi:hypothetical protein